MTTRETIAWALAAGLAVVLAGAVFEIKDLAYSASEARVKTMFCEDDKAQCLETLDLCGRVLTEVAAKCGECP